MTGLCFKTKRIGIQVIGDTRMLVLIERLLPLADSDGDDDERYFDALQTAVLEVVQTQGEAAGEAGSYGRLP